MHKKRQRKQVTFAKSRAFYIKFFVQFVLNEAFGVMCFMRAKP